MKKLLGVLMVAGMAVLFSFSGANAATCWWNGFTWVCRTHPHARHWWRPHHWYQAYGPWRHHYYWHHGYYGRPYAWYR